MEERITQKMATIRRYLVWVQETEEGEGDRGEPTRWGTEAQQGIPLSFTEPPVHCPPSRWFLARRSYESAGFAGLVGGGTLLFLCHTPPLLTAWETWGTGVVTGALGMLALWIHYERRKAAYAGDRPV